MLRISTSVVLPRHASTAATAVRHTSGIPRRNVVRRAPSVQIAQRKAVVALNRAQRHVDQATANLLKAGRPKPLRTAGPGRSASRGLSTASVDLHFVNGISMETMVADKTVEFPVELATDLVVSVGAVAALLAIA